MKDNALGTTVLFCLAVFAFAFGICNATDASDFFGGWLVGLGMAITVGKFFDC